MKTHRELEQIMRARYEEVEARFEQADALFREPNLPAGLERMRPICLPDGHLDFLRTRGAIQHMARTFDAEKRQAIRVALVALDIENQEIANGLIYFGAVENGLEYYAGRDDLMARDAVAVCHALLEHTEKAIALWHDLLEDGLEFLAARYNFAEVLLWERRLMEARHQFKACRNLYPHYRDTLFFLDVIETNIFMPPPVDPDPIATALFRPVYTITEAVSKE